MGSFSVKTDRSCPAKTSRPSRRPSSLHALPQPSAMAKLLSWDQDVTTVYARFTVPKGTRASQVRVDAAVNSLLVFVLPSDSTLSYVYEGQKEGGELSKTIISADVLWTLEEDDGGRRVVHVVLPKSTTGQLDKPWRTLFAEHEEVEGDEEKSMADCLKELTFCDEPSTPFDELPLDVRLHMEELRRRKYAMGAGYLNPAEDFDDFRMVLTE